MNTQNELPTFHYVFQLTKTVMFNVNYYRLGNNTSKYFSTSADHFNKPKTDFDQCGQAQESLLFGEAMKFYKKWDYMHTEDISSEQYKEMLQDIELLKAKYNFLYSDDKDFNFSDVRTFSKQTPKK